MCQKPIVNITPKRKLRELASPQKTQGPRLLTLVENNALSSTLQFKGFGARSLEIQEESVVGKVLTSRTEAAENPQRKTGIRLIYVKDEWFFLVFGFFQESKLMS